MRDTQLRFLLYIFRTRVIFRVFRCRSHSAIFRESTASQHIYKAYSPVLESSPVRWFPLKGQVLKGILMADADPNAQVLGSETQPSPTKLLTTGMLQSSVLGCGFSPYIRVPLLLPDGAQRQSTARGWGA